MLVKHSQNLTCNAEEDKEKGHHRWTTFYVSGALFSALLA